MIMLEMNRSKLLGRSRVVTTLYISIFALVLLLRIDPLPPALAFNPVSNGSVVQSSNGLESVTDANNGGLPPCDPQDPSCGFSPCDPNDPACTDSGGNAGGGPGDGTGTGGGGNDGGLPPCDPQDPICGFSPCDPKDPACPANGDNGGSNDNGGNGGGGAPPPCDPQDPSCGFSPCDPKDPACPGGGSPPPCDIQDPACGGLPPPCDLQDPSCIITPCDPLDPACIITPCDPADPLCTGQGGAPHSCDPQNSGCSPFPTSEETCDDGIDNDGNGIVDDPSQCSHGGPPLPAFPGGGATTPASKLSPIGDPNILGVAPNILGVAPNILGVAEAKLSTENICNDGIDNDHNNLKDMEDPSCGDIIQSNNPTLMTSSGKIIPTVEVVVTENLTLNKLKGTSALHSVSGNEEDTGRSTTTVISIIGVGTGQSHDIRTVSLHYKYSQDKITVTKGSKVVWLNDDPSQSHGINVLERISGKLIYTYPVIRSGNSAYFIFDNPGEYVYTDSQHPTMTGLITVLG